MTKRGPTFGNYQNIDRSILKPGQYTGYAEGAVYRIRRTSSKTWQAVPMTGDGHAPVLFAPTLAAMGARLKEVANVRAGKHIGDRTVTVMKREG